MNPLLTSYRIFKKYKVLAATNILALTIGLTSTFFILAWVLYETSYDEFHVNKSSLFKVLLNSQNSDGVISTNMTTPYPLASSLDQVANVKGTLQITIEDDLDVIYDDMAYKTKAVTASPNFFNIMSFPIIEGNTNQVLENINSIAISKSLSERLFEGEALGKTLRIFTVEDYINYEITGVFENVPSNSSLQFDAVLPLEAFIKRNKYPDSWENNWLQTFIVANEGVKKTALNETINDFVQKMNPEWKNSTYLQSFEDIHLYDTFVDGINTGGRIEYVRLAIIVLILILLITIVNYSNLIITLSYKRTKEIGMRRILGISKFKIFLSSFSDAVLVILLSLILSTILIIILFTDFKSLIGASLFTQYNGFIYPLILTIFIAILLAGAISIFPSIHFWSVKPITALKNEKKVKNSKLRFNELLLVAQFSITTGLLIFTTIVSRQMKALYDKDLGFNFENVIVLLMDEGLYTNLTPLKQELKSLSFIDEIGYSAFDFDFDPGTTGDITWNGKGKEYDGFSIAPILVDQDFTKTLDLKFTRGRDFSQNSSDLYSFIINEAAAERLPWENPLNQELSMWGKTGNIVGVVEDFNIKPLYNSIEPVIMQLDPDECEYLFVKTIDKISNSELDALKSKLVQFSPYYSFNYENLSDIVKYQYKSDALLKDVFSWASVFIIIISSLGLFSFSAFAVQQYDRDISIRKVYGSSIFNVVLNYSIRFIKLILFAVLISLPFVIYFGKEWLANYSYQTPLSIIIFLFPCLLILILSSFCVSYNVYNIGRVNPSKILRN
ncbi:ABC transporter permease [Maribacter flavus]|uniref:FtsX-like permease family protein n=1 Tax=Maribacter flavus TaxID=1658664 RepID=A0A5B2TNK4_9FLAO|nr:ABC transporter permease [Maribacter flavus]KAA2215799.1 FtsX-like permease family protein [Maribacter flavus]